MRLIKQEDDMCAVTAFTMLLNHVKGLTAKPDTVFTDIGRYWPDNYPFEEPYENIPRVPSVEEFCHHALNSYNIAMVPFPKNPMAFVAVDSTRVQVWQDPEGTFEYQMRMAPGIIEGLRGDGRGHMVAWDKQVIFDPRGYCYSLNACDRFDYEPCRFWAALEVK